MSASRHWEACNDTKPRQRCELDQHPSEKAVVANSEVGACNALHGGEERDPEGRSLSRRSDTTVDNQIHSSPRRVHEHISGTVGLLNDRKVRQRLFWLCSGSTTSCTVNVRTVVSIK